jgi:hypothetical protein
MDSRLHGNDGKIVFCVTSVTKIVNRLLDKRVTRILKSGCYIPLGTEDHASMDFLLLEFDALLAALTRHKVQPM